MQDPNRTCDTTSNSTCTYYTTCTYVYAPDPWAVAGSLWQIYFHCMIKPRPKSLLRCTSHENWHSISDWCSVNSASIPSAITITATVSLSNNLSQPWPVLACVPLQVSCSEEKKKKRRPRMYMYTCIHHVSLPHRPETGFPLSPHIPDSDLLKKKAPKSYNMYITGIHTCISIRGRRPGVICI